jgi:hypothetical protein
MNRVFVSLLLLASWGALSFAQQKSRLYGTVVDDAGNPVADASIEAENPINMPSQLNTRTDKKGKFAFGGINVGEWKLAVTAEGYHPYEESFASGPARICERTSPWSGRPARRFSRLRKRFAVRPSKRGSSSPRAITRARSVCFKSS